MWCGQCCRRWSRSPERKRSKVWRRAASPDSSSDSDGGGGGQQFLEQEGRRRAGRAGRFGTGAAADARAHHVRALHFHAVLSHRMANASCMIAPVVVVRTISCVCSCRLFLAMNAVLDNLSYAPFCMRTKAHNSSPSYRG